MSSPLIWPFNRFRQSSESLLDRYNDDSIMTTEMRRLARNLRYAHYTHQGQDATNHVSDVKAVLFTSAQAHEGKSFITSLLGITIAKDNPGQKILLIDSDLRRSKLHEFFVQSLTPGLSEVLQDTSSLNEAIQHTDLPNLFLLPGGNADAISPERLLAASRTHELLRACCDFFDMILIDAPPIIPVDDVSILAPYTDGVVMVVMAKHTVRGEVERAIELVHASQAELLGIVINKVKQIRHRYGHYSSKERTVA